jgi:ankyrin repeat protein
MSNFLLFCLVLVAVCLSHNYVVMAADSTDAAAGEGADEELHPSILLESVLKGDVAGIKQALAAGESVDTVNVNGWSAAMFAVVNGNIEALEVLIENEIDLNNADNDGITPLMRAAMAVRNLP